jgi:predicted RNase H-like nuclease (RuvC/YqgF family)
MGNRSESLKSSRFYDIIKMARISGKERFFMTREELIRENEKLKKENQLQQKEIADLKKENDSLKNKTESLAQRIDNLMEQLLKRNKMLFGRKSEQEKYLTDGQMELPNVLNKAEVESGGVYKEPRQNWHSNFRSKTP